MRRFPRGNRTEPILVMRSNVWTLSVCYIVDSWPHDRAWFYERFRRLRQRSVSTARVSEIAIHLPHLPLEDFLFEKSRVTLLWVFSWHPRLVALPVDHDSDVSWLSLSDARVGVPAVEWTPLTTAKALESSALSPDSFQTADTIERQSGSPAILEVFGSETHRSHLLATVLVKAPLLAGMSLFTLSIVNSGWRIEFCLFRPTASINPSGLFSFRSSLFSQYQSPVDGLARDSEFRG